MTVLHLAQLHSLLLLRTMSGMWSAIRQWLPLLSQRSAMSKRSVTRADELQRAHAAARTHPAADALHAAKLAQAETAGHLRSLSLSGAYESSDARRRQFVSLAAALPSLEEFALYNIRAHQVTPARAPTRGCLQRRAPSTCLTRLVRRQRLAAPTRGTIGTGSCRSSATRCSRWRGRPPPRVV